MLRKLSQFATWSEKAQLLKLEITMPILNSSLDNNEDKVNVSAFHFAFYRTQEKA